ncbi:NUDIX domain-containing protein [Vibrio sp. ABG19]|uniref:NUDIX hydrolase n=1 Tax=Vibrio sp. ABG19 TaxID=2817385 RepID=UPI00249F65BF|nr:NUDIX domain-containing protein [Vibrio sp. ABG19]WGY44937.1 NUDIX domain-containing protein [Vibrio sp. ABG19]
MEVFQCVSFLVVKDNQVLLEKRSAEKTCDPNLVAIPGGHIEAGESQQEALARELLEELAITPTESVYLCSLYHPTNELQLLHYYVIPAWQGEIGCHEADEVFWRPINPDWVDTRADKLALAEYLRLFQTGILSA